MFWHETTEQPSCAFTHTEITHVFTIEQMAFRYAIVPRMDNHPGVVLVSNHDVGIHCRDSRATKHLLMKRSTVNNLVPSFDRLYKRLYERLYERACGPILWCCRSTLIVIRASSITDHSTLCLPRPPSAAKTTPLATVDSASMQLCGRIFCTSCCDTTH